MEEDSKIPLILGRPFLATGRALIDASKGELKLRVNDEEVLFSIYNAIKGMQDEKGVEECRAIDVIDACVEEKIARMQPADTIENFISHSLSSNSVIDFDDSDLFEFMNSLEILQEFSDEYGINLDYKPIEGIPIEKSELNSSGKISNAPKPDIKPLPDHLTYAFLGNDNTYPVIISSDLTENELDKLLKVLRKHRSAIGWSLSDLKGISSSICMHKILLEETYTHCVQHQRRLNSLMQEVVRKEVLKWLDNGIIFPISDSEWVSPTQVVPKKMGE